MAAKEDAHMRTWVRQHPRLALAVVYFALMLVGAGIWLVFDNRDVVGTLVSTIFYTLLYWLLISLSIRKSRKNRERLAKEKKLMVYIRYPNARSGSLSTIWNQGIATPSSGSLVFQPVVYDDLVPVGAPRTITVRAIHGERRKSNGADRKYIADLGNEILTLEADSGTIEVASTPESLDVLEAALTRESGTA